VTKSETTAVRFISTEEAAEFSHLSERQIREAIVDGRLAALKVQTGKRKSIKTVFPAHLVKYMAEHLTVKTKEDTEQLSQALEAWIAAKDGAKNGNGSARPTTKT
jgi:hypothetical protein